MLAKRSVWLSWVALLWAALAVAGFVRTRVVGSGSFLRLRGFIAGEGGPPPRPGPPP